MKKIQKLGLAMLSCILLTSFGVVDASMRRVSGQLAGKGSAAVSTATRRMGAFVNYDGVKTVIMSPSEAKLHAYDVLKDDPTARVRIINPDVSKLRVDTVHHMNDTARLRDRDIDTGGPDVGGFYAETTDLTRDSDTGEFKTAKGPLYRVLELAPASENPRLDVVQSVGGPKFQQFEDKTSFGNLAKTPGFYADPFKASDTLVQGLAKRQGEFVPSKINVDKRANRLLPNVDDFGPNSYFYKSYQKPGESRWSVEALRNLMTLQDQQIQTHQDDIFNLGRHNVDEDTIRQDLAKAADEQRQKQQLEEQEIYDQKGEDALVAYKKEAAKHQILEEQQRERFNHMVDQINSNTTQQEQRSSRWSDLVNRVMGK